MDRVLSSMPFLSSALARQGSAMRGEIERTSIELATGRTRDPGATLAGDFSALASIDHSLSRIAGHRTTTSELGLLAETMQIALGVVSDAAVDLSTNLLASSTLQSEDQLSSLFADGGRRFDTAIGALNTRFSERAVFGGTEADAPPLPDADVILSALETAVAGAATVQDAMTAINDWFTGATGYETMYAGGPGRADLPIAPGETASLTVTALDPAIRETLAGLAAVALLDRGMFAGQTATRAELGQAAAQSLLSTGEARSILQARIGTVEAQVADAAARNASEKTALDMARNGLLEVDPYQTAAELQDLQTRLEAFYVITSRLSRLNLTEYLR